MPLPGLAIAGGALAGGSLLGSILNRPNYNTPDVGGELDKIAGLFAQLRANNTSNINYEAGQGRRTAASNLAGRGIYSSPVSQNTFNALEDSRLRSIATSDAQLAGQEAEARSGILRSLLGLNQQNQMMRNQANANIFGQVGGLGSSLLLTSLLSPAAAGGGAAPAAAAGGAAGGGGGGNLAWLRALTGGR